MKKAALKLTAALIAAFALALPAFASPAAGFGEVNVVMTNVKTVDAADLREMAQKAGKENKAVIVSAHTTDKNGEVIASLRFDAAKAAAALEREEDPQPVKLSVETNTQNTRNLVALFQKWFGSRNMAAFKLAQKGELPFPVEVAVKVDVEKFNTDALNVYAYNAAANTYKDLENTGCTVDPQGFLRLNTATGGYLLITDTPLSQAAAEPLPPKENLCAACRTGEMVKTDTYDHGWRTTAFAPCHEGATSHLDKYQEHTVITYYACDHCGIYQKTEAFSDRYICQ